MVFFWFIIPVLVLMVLVGRRHRREEDDSGDSHDDPQYEVGEGFEEEEGNVGCRQRFIETLVAICNKS
jgi:hypothetical protein